jgi:NAD+ synthase (glutamine-hydrolysing)
VVVDLDRTTRCRREASTWRSDLEQFRATTDEVPRPTVASRWKGRSRERAARTLRRPDGTTSSCPRARGAAAAARELLDDLFDALALGVADYYRKTARSRAIGIALSGGRDSLLTLLVAWRAVSDRASPGLVDETRSAAKMGEAAAHAFYMPTRFSSERDASDAAEQIAKDLGATFMCCPSRRRSSARAAARDDARRGGRADRDHAQNIQARIRGQRMWNWANTSGRSSSRPAT